MSTRPEMPLVKSRWSSTTATRIVSSSSMLKNLHPFILQRSAYRLLYPLSAERAVGQPGPYRIVHASGVFIGDLDQAPLGNLNQVIRPGQQSSRSRAISAGDSPWLLACCLVSPGIQAVRRFKRSVRSGKQGLRGDMFSNGNRDGPSRSRQRGLGCGGDGGTSGPDRPSE